MRVAVRWVLLTCVLAGLLGGTQATATTVTVVAAGTLTTFVDSNSVTDGSIAIGSPYTMTMTYDDSVPDGDPNPLASGYAFPGVLSTYSVAVGNYTFTAAGTLLIGVFNGANVPNRDELIWYVDQFSIVGALDPGVTVGPTSYSNPALTDFTGNAVSSDQLTLAVWNRSLYSASATAFNLFVEVVDPRTTGRDSLDMTGSISAFVVTLPEPGVAWLLVVAGGAAVLRRRE